MASPVDTSVKFFHSSMSNAPVLNGVAGSLISLLDACLKDGFDLKTATSLVVAGGVATLTFTGTHASVVDSVLLVSGSSISALNGEQKVTARTPTTVSFATAAADGTATGTITFRMAPAGWLKPFSGTNLAVYKSADVTSTGCHLRVNDTGTTTARVVGYETMSDVDTGIGVFPSASQMSGGGYWLKSTTANATANGWLLLADSRAFYFICQPAIGNSAAMMSSVTRMFGDVLALRPGGDPFACALNYAATNSTSNETGACDGVSSAQHAMPRNHTGLGSSTLYTPLAYANVSYTSGADPSLGAFPSPIDGGLRMTRRYLATASAQPPRAEFPALMHVSHTLLFDTFKFLDQIVGSGQLAGRRLIAAAPASAALTTSSSSNTGISFFDITGPWR